MEVSAASPDSLPTPAPAQVETPKAPPAPAPAAAPPVSTPAAMPAPAPTPAPAVARSAAGPQRLMIRALDATWIRVQPDEGRATEELLPAGASREGSAARRFLLTIGNAGGGEGALNGKVLPPLGPQGTVIQRLYLPPGSSSRP